jgi:hypothetical protein
LGRILAFELKEILGRIVSRNSHGRNLEDLGGATSFKGKI